MNRYAIRIQMFNLDDPPLPYIGYPIIAQREFLGIHAPILLLGVLDRMIALAREAESDFTPGKEKEKDSPPPPLPSSERSPS